MTLLLVGDDLPGGQPLKGLPGKPPPLPGREAGLGHRPAPRPAPTHRNGRRAEPGLLTRPARVSSWAADGGQDPRGQVQKENVGPCSKRMKKPWPVWLGG